MKINYMCSDCGSEFAKWVARCGCGSFEIKEYKEPKEVTFTEEFEENSEQAEPIICDIEEFKRVCQLLTKSIYLIGGEPGIGKSTLMSQIASSIEGTCLYLTGEEAVENVNNRLKRIQPLINKENQRNNKVIVQTFFLFESIKGLIEKHKPKLIIIDSIHTTRTQNEDRKQNLIILIGMVAKQHNCGIIVVSHITKEGIISGPKTLEHMVDVVLYLEGDRYGTLRMLRAIKNRFGPTNETGVFEMNEYGLEEVSNPSSIFISQRRQGVPGSVVFAGMMGSRPLLTEAQALIVDAQEYNLECVSFDHKRLKMIIAILGRWCNLNFYNKNVFINFVGGMKITDPGADLPVAVALISAYKKRTISPEVCFVGELGLTGEIRRVSHMDSRVKEVQRLGFKKIYSNYDQKKIDSSIIQHIELLSTVLDMM